jgi:hypothetical protein
MKPETTSLYVIYPHSPDRHVLYAPQTNVVFFYGIDNEKVRWIALFPHVPNDVQVCQICSRVLHGH